MIAHICINNRHLIWIVQLHYLTKFVQLIPAFLIQFDKKVRNIRTSQSHRKSHIRSLWVFIWCAWNERPLQGRMLEVCYTIGQYSHVDNVLVRIAPDPSQPLSQFINALDVCTVNTFLHCRPYLLVNRVEVWAVLMSKIQQNKVWLLSTQQSDIITCMMCRCIVLPKRV